VNATTAMDYKTPKFSYNNFQYSVTSHVFHNFMKYPTSQCLNKAQKQYKNIIYSIFYDVTLEKSTFIYLQET